MKVPYMAISVYRNNPEHPYCTNWHFPHGIVLGNGPSRNDLDLKSLREHAVIYGCNALYKDFNPDLLFANDINMILDILKAQYRGKCIFFELSPWPKEHVDQILLYHKDPITGESVLTLTTEEFGTRECAEEFVFISHQETEKIHIWLSPEMSNFQFVLQHSPVWGRSTGLRALQYALEHGGHNRITLHGFDSHTSGSYDNIYKDKHPVYVKDARRIECKEKNIPYIPTEADDWESALQGLKEAHPHVKVKLVK